MISVQEAEKLIRENLSDSETRKIRLQDLQVEVVREALVADRNLPPYHRVAMDGIAIRFSTWARGLRRFRIEGVQEAGQPAQELRFQENCYEVMTGAVLPLGCDCVIRYEDIDIRKGFAHPGEDLRVRQNQNVHQQGSDYQAGDLLVEKNNLMLSPHWAIAASVGKSSVQVSRRPQIAVISTGDEIIEADRKPQPHQIRGCNSYALLSALRSSGFSEVSLHHIPDRKGELRDQLEKALLDNHFLIISGGVSKGKFDFVTQILSELKVVETFHGIRQKPGKPLWFGIGARKQAVFGLPGNPVSALICFRRYVLPALKRMLCLETPEEWIMPFAVLQEEVKSRKSLTQFVPVKVNFERDGRILASPVKVNGSGDFASLANSDGFLELSENRTVFKPGEAWPLWPWREW